MDLKASLIAFEYPTFKAEDWVDERETKTQNIFACVLAMVKKVVAFVFSVLLFPSSWMHEKETE